MSTQRFENLLNKMNEEKVDQVLIADPASIFYLTGKLIHTGHRLFALTVDKNANKHISIHQMFQIREDIGVNVHYFSDTDCSVKELCNNIIDEGVLAVDGEWPTRFLLKLMEYKPNLKIVTKPLIESVRQIKNTQEIEFMKVASSLNDKAMDMLVKNFDPNWTEIDTINKLKEFFDSEGTEGFSFDPIVCYGANAADPHHVSDNVTLIKEGECILFDIGCIKDGFCSDMSRTFFYKKADEKSSEVYNIVLEAQKRAVNAVKPGVKFCELDAIARDYITEKGYGEFFNHRLGHFIGMEVHEHGDVSATNSEIAKEGMIFSIEPGIYLENELGVRIEDLVLVTKDGHYNLNNFSKEITLIK